MTELNRVLSGRAIQPPPRPPALPLSFLLATHVADFDRVRLPSSVRELTRITLLDQVGVMLAASGMAPNCAPFVALARAGGEGHAQIIGHGFGATAMMAAFANGAMAHALDFEDTHDPTLVHPHAPVIAAALALGQEREASGDELIAAIAIGADLSCRLALGLASNAEASGFLLYPTIGVFGATAAAARLLKLDVARTVQAFALAFGQATQSSRIKTYGPSDVRAVRDAFNAKAAVTAALLAEAGIEAFDRPIEGEAGYYDLYSAGGFDPAPVLADLGERFHGEDVSFKPWPCCRGTHAFIEAALALRAQAPVEAIERIDVSVSPFFAVLCEPPEQRRRPIAPIGAKFSIPFAVALALEGGKVTLDDFFPDRLAAPELLRLTERVHHRVDATRGQSAATGGSLTITLRDGRRISHQVDHPRGHPLNPMTPEELMAKFRDCAQHAATPLDHETTLRLEQALAAVDRLPSIAQLF